MSLVLAIVGFLFLAAAHFFSPALSQGQHLSAQGVNVARAVHLPFLIAGIACLALGVLLSERLPLRRRIRVWLPRESQLLLPGLAAFGLVQVIFVLVKLAEYSRTLVARHEFWDTYLLLGRLRLNVPSEPFTLSDYLNSTFLLIAGVTALLVRAALTALRPAAAPPPARRDLAFWTLLGAGFVYLAFDEILMFHEYIGANLGFDDGRIVFGYFLLMMATALAFRRKFLSQPAAFACLAIGGCFQGLGAVADRFHFWEGAFTLEEVAEMSASGFYLLAILQYAYGDMRVLAGQAFRAMPSREALRPVLAAVFPAGAASAAGEIEAASPTARPVRAQAPFHRR